MIVSTKKIVDILSLAEVVMCVNQQFTGQIWWRGHSKACYRLRPSVFRARENSGGHAYEQNINERFMQKAPALYENIPEKSDWFGWLYLMQHYGLPTRLMDWTESPFTACYFAVNEDECDGALFALSPYRLNYTKIECHQLLDSRNEIAMKIARRAFNIDTDSSSTALAILPELNDKRMIAQLSVFTIHDGKEPLENHGKSSDFLVKYIIPSESKKLLRDQLKFAGTRPSSLFPDLENLSKEIREIREFRETMEELNGNHKDYLRNGENYSCGSIHKNKSDFYIPQEDIKKLPLSLNDVIVIAPPENQQKAVTKRPKYKFKDNPNRWSPWPES